MNKLQKQILQESLSLIREMAKTQQEDIKALMEKIDEDNTIGDVDKVELVLSNSATLVAIMASSLAILMEIELERNNRK